MLSWRCPSPLPLRIWSHRIQGRKRREEARKEEGAFSTLCDCFRRQSRARHPAVPTTWRTAHIKAKVAVPSLIACEKEQMAVDMLDFGWQDQAALLLNVLLGSGGRTWGAYTPQYDPCAPHTADIAQAGTLAAGCTHSPGDHLSRP